MMTAPPIDDAADRRFVGPIWAAPDRWSWDGPIRSGSTWGRLIVGDTAALFRPFKLIAWAVPAFDLSPDDVRTVEGRGSLTVRFELEDDLGAGWVRFFVLVGARDNMLRRLASIGFPVAVV